MPDILRQLNWIDIFFIILLMGMIYKGVRSGVAGQMIPLVGTFFIVFLSIGYYKSSSEAFFGSLLQGWAKPLSFFLICSLVLFIFKITSKLFNITPSEDMAVIERFAGIAIAVLRTVMICGIISLGLLLIPVNGLKNSVINDSKIALRLAKADVDIYHVLAQLVQKDTTVDKESIINDFTSNMETVSLKKNGDKK